MMSSSLTAAYPWLLLILLMLRLVCSSLSANALQSRCCTCAAAG